VQTERAAEIEDAKRRAASERGRGKSQRGPVEAGARGHVKDVLIGQGERLRQDYIGELHVAVAQGIRDGGPDTRQHLAPIAQSRREVALPYLSPPSRIVTEVLLRKLSLPAKTHGLTARPNKQRVR
jgi:hypothetical protein